MAVRVTAPLRLTEAVRERGREQLASLSTAAMMSGRVAVMMKESFGRVGEARGGKETTLCSWERWGSFGDTTLA